MDNVEVIKKVATEIMGAKTEKEVETILYIMAYGILAL